MSEIETAVLGFIREERPDLTIAPETELMEAGILDSIALIKAIQFIEQTFDIRIADEDMDPAIFATPRAIAAFIAKKQGAGTVAAE